VEFEFNEIPLVVPSFSVSLQISGFGTAVRKAYPSNGNDPDAGGSAFWSRKENDGILRKKNLNLSKIAQCPSSLALPVGLPFSLVLSFGQQKKVQSSDKSADVRIQNQSESGKRRNCSLGKPYLDRSAIFIFVLIYYQPKLNS